MDEVAALVDELGKLLEESSQTRLRAPRATDRMTEVATTAWLRADEVAKGLQRVATDAALPTCVGAFGRMLWEDMTTLEYVQASPETRVPQLLASALDHSRKLAKTKWGKERKLRGLGRDEAEMLKARRRHENEVMKRLGIKKLTDVPVDDQAVLPKLWQRATAINAYDQFEVPYAMESAGAVHFGLVALYDGRDDETRRGKLLRALTLGVLSYRVLLGRATLLLGMSEDSERLLAPLHERAAAREATQPKSGKTKGR